MASLLVPVDLGTCFEAMWAGSRRKSKVRKAGGAIQYHSGTTSSSLNVRMLDENRRRMRGREREDKHQL